LVPHNPALDGVAGAGEYNWKLMNTSRAQVDRILKAKGNVTIETLQRAAALVGRQVRLELV
jgi:hypothetical protein